jgi:hypothetical protein
MRVAWWMAGVCLLAGLPAAVAAEEARPYEKVAFYFSAHQDDWQLFMTPSAFTDVADAKTKAVFIYMTAGDAGLGVGWRGRKHPYYLARENGARAATRFMVDADHEPSGETASQQVVNGHPVHRVSYRNAVSYFLRVPDGNLDGVGYSVTGFQSLRRVADGKVSSLAAIDGSTTYHGWKDLTATLGAILDFERGGAPNVQLNVADPDERINPGDHSDHLMTARAAPDAAAGLGCARRAYYVDYASRTLPENLSPEERDQAASVFAVTAAGVWAMDHGANWRWYDRAYAGRNYYRVEEGRGLCTAPAQPLAVAKTGLTARYH